MAKLSDKKLDERLAQVQAETDFLDEIYKSIDDYCSVEKIGKQSSFDTKAFFKDVVQYYKDIKKRTEPEVVLWRFVGALFDQYSKFAHDEKVFKLAIERATGYNGQFPKQNRMKEAGQLGARITRPAMPVEKPFVPVTLEEEKKTLQEDLKDKLGDMEGPAVTKSHKSLAEDVTALNPAAKSKVDAILVNKTMCESEEKWLTEREWQYKNEFQLNNSSDQPLLEEILYCELILRRMNSYMREEKNVYILQQKKTVFDQLTSAMNALGISRKKRVEDEEDLKDTITDAVETFEHYVKHIDQFEMYYCLTEYEMLLQRYDRGELPEFLFLRYTYGISPEEARKIYEEKKHLIPILEKKIKDLQV